MLPAAPAAKYGGVVGVAMQYLGTPYVYGGASPSGFDCSGFIMYVYAQVGVSLPHNAAAQYGYGTPVDRSQLQPGDLVFFNGLGHAGIYVGGGSFIHSPHTGDVVKISIDARLVLVDLRRRPPALGRQQLPAPAFTLATRLRADAAVLVVVRVAFALLRTGGANLGAGLDERTHGRLACGERT